MRDLIKHLTSKSDTQLMKMLENAIRSPQDPRAATLKEEIFKVWYERGIEFLRKGGVADLSDEGVLSAFGYRVGHQGIKSSKIRQQKLELVLNAHIPPILNSYYLREWGTPGSFKRRQKLARVLSKFIRGAENRTRNRLSYQLARSQWESDLNYVQAS